MYTTPIDQITFSRIAEFIHQKNPESPILDYKGDWTSDLGKVIAAMANTSGGIILIGVTEDAKTGFPADIVGVAVAPGVDHCRQRVTSIAYQAIYPPVFPEIAVCPLVDDPTRAVVVIRVEQSDRTPHAVDQRRRVYVRVDSTTQPHSWEELATLDQLEWLRDRRKAAVEARNGLIGVATERSTWFVHSRSHRQRVPILRAWVVPYFSSGEEVLTPHVVGEILRGRPVSSNVGHGGVSFPDFVSTSRSIATGHCGYSSNDRVMQYYELGTSGLLFSEIAIEPLPGNNEPAQKVVYMLQTLPLIDGLVKLAHLAQSKGHVCGLLWVYACLKYVQGALLDLQNREWPFYRGPSEDRQSPDDDLVLADQVMRQQDLLGSRRQIVRNAAWVLVQAFGVGWGQPDFETWFSRSVWHEA
jgi:hypothetical protein